MLLFIYVLFCVICILLYYFAESCNVLKYLQEGYEGGTEYWGGANPGLTIPGPVEVVLLQIRVCPPLHTEVLQHLQTAAQQRTVLHMLIPSSANEEISMTLLNATMAFWLCNYNYMYRSSPLKCEKYELQRYKPQKFLPSKFSGCVHT